MLVLFFPLHGHGDSPHLQALNTISVLMVPRCLFNPDVSLRLQTHIQSSPDTSTWVSNKSLEMNMFKMKLLTSPRPPLPAVFPISAMAEHSSQFLAANLLVLDSFFFLTPHIWFLGNLVGFTSRIDPAFDHVSPLYPTTLSQATIFFGLVSLLPDLSPTTQQPASSL